MLRSQLAAAQTWHLGDWNAFWENCFLDYRLHFLFKEDVYGIGEKVKQPLFRKLADSAHVLLAAASSHFPPHPLLHWPTFTFGPKPSNAVQVGADFRLAMAPGSNGKFDFAKLF